MGIRYRAIFSSAAHCVNVYECVNLPKRAFLCLDYFSVGIIPTSGCFNTCLRFEVLPVVFMVIHVAGIWRGWYIVPTFRSFVLPSSGYEQCPRRHNHVFCIPANTVGWHRSSRTLAALSKVASDELWWLQWQNVDDFWQEVFVFYYQ